jgi:hypothetical protein
MWGGRYGLAKYHETQVRKFYNWFTTNAVHIIVTLVAFSALCMLLLRLQLIFAYIPDLGGIESNVIYSLQRLLGGYPLYADPAHAPYSITQYTPLYYYLCGAIGWLLRIDPDEAYHVYVLSRSVSLVLNLAFAATAFAILRQIFRVNFFLSFTAFAYAFVYLDEESFSRPDSLYNLLALLSIGCFLKFLSGRKSKPDVRFLLGAAAGSVVAIFAKQSAIYLPVLLIFYLLFYLKNVRQTVLSFLIMLITFGLFLMLGNGGSFYNFIQNTVLGVNNGVSIAWFVERIAIEHFQKERFINIIGLFVGFYWLARGLHHPQRFLGLATLGSFLFALVTSVKVGAAPNYFTEFITLTVIGSIIFIVTHDPLFNRPSVRTYRHTALFYLILVAFTLPPRFLGKFEKKYRQVNNVGKQNYEANQKVAHYLYEEVNLEPQEQVFVTTHVHDYLNKLLYRNVIFPQKEIVIANPPGVYDYSLFGQGVREGTVAYVVASVPEGHVDLTEDKPKISFDFIGTDFSAYVPIKQIGNYLIFKHPQAKPERSQQKEPPSHKKRWLITIQQINR